MLPFDGKLILLYFQAWVLPARRNALRSTAAESREPCSAPEEAGEDRWLLSSEFSWETTPVPFSQTPARPAWASLRGSSQGGGTPEAAPPGKRGVWLICVGDLGKRSFRTSINVPLFCCVNCWAPSRGHSKEPRVGMQPQGKRLLTPANLPPPVPTRGVGNRIKKPKTALEGKGLSPQPIP